MAPKKKQPKRAAKAGKRSKSKPSTKTSSKNRVAKKPAAPTTPRPPRTRAAKKLAKERAAAQEDDEEGEDDADGEAGPPKKSGRQTRPRNRKAPDTDGDDDDEEEEGTSTRPPPATSSKTDAPMGKATSGGRNDGGERDVDPEAPGTDGADDKPIDEATVDGENSLERYFDGLVDVHATTESRQQVQFEGNDADLVLSLKVFSDPHRPNARLGYHAQLSLTQTVQNARGEDEQQTRVIGYIKAWRITKQTANLPNVSDTQLTEILNLDNDFPLVETTKCLRALYKLNGEPRAAVGEHTAQLTDNPLMFIEMIYIRRQFAGNGLLTPALDRFYLAISQLPEWFAFAGTLVLSPAPPSDSKGDVWPKDKGKEQDVANERTLAGIYRARGFATWISMLIQGEKITIMGRERHDK